MSSVEHLCRVPRWSSSLSTLTASTAPTAPIATDVSPLPRRCCLGHSCRSRSTTIRRIPSPRSSLRCPPSPRPWQSQPLPTPTSDSLDRLYQQHNATPTRSPPRPWPGPPYTLHRSSLRISSLFHHRARPLGSQHSNADSQRPTRFGILDATDTATLQTRFSPFPSVPPCPPTTPLLIYVPSVPSRLPTFCLLSHPHMLPPNLVASESRLPQLATCKSSQCTWDIQSLQSSSPQTRHRHYSTSALTCNMTH
jgi:hypothetical protein